MRIKEVIGALERFAPLPLQDGFDNAGMQIGLTEAEVAGALLCLDVTEAVIDEAIAWDCNLIVAHHPLLFKGCKSITGANYTERCILKAIKNDIAIYAAHTNLDNAIEGVNFKIAEKIGLTNVHFLEEKNPESGSGIIGELDEPETELAFLKRIKQTFEVSCLKHNKLLGREIRTVALCGGAGAFLMPAAIARHADVFITGEIKYHEYFGRDNDILLAEIGHYESEQYTKEILYNIIREAFPNLHIQMCRTNTNPIKYL
ncbi:MAG: Nif3-like dinuclear metal center hexameric protein [Prevotellaceae bacterium]|jgi:dinuclear metal center YbgI/SA1388 family protein|nr:Nif3-like dinuclear metal center hexameric protein [Prevotellaceae bacterium]